MFSTINELDGQSQRVSLTISPGSLSVEPDVEQFTLPEGSYIVLTDAGASVTETGTTFRSGQVWRANKEVVFRYDGNGMSTDMLGYDPRNGSSETTYTLSNVSDLTDEVFQNAPAASTDTAGVVKFARDEYFQAYMGMPVSDMQVINFLDGATIIPVNPRYDTGAAHVDDFEVILDKTFNAVCATYSNQSFNAVSDTIFDLSSFASPLLDWNEPETPVTHTIGISRDGNISVSEDAGTYHTGPVSWNVSG